MSANLAVTAVLDRRKDLSERWSLADADTQVRVRVSLLAIAVVAAFHYTIESLVQTINFDTPLAYIGLVPLIAAALAYGLRRPSRPEPEIHDRQLDYIIGVPLIAAALAINLFLPSQQSVLFWVRRMDLVSLPLFVAGAVALLFGTRVLWRQKLAIAYLFLAWPWPYTTILLGTLNGFTNVTVAALTAALGVVHFAAPVHAANGETGLYSIVHNGVPFPVSVVTACSGVDGMVGFLLVGTAFAIFVRGGLIRKVLWLLAGFVLLWTTNLVRLLLIFWAGQKWGEQMALRVLHPIAGLIIFNIGVILMILMLRPFGLRLLPKSAASEPATPVTSPKKPSSRTTPIYLVGGLLLAAAMILNVNNTSLESYNLVLGASGAPRVPSYLADPATPAGWTPVFTNEYVQGKSLFGESSRWFRYTYFDRGTGPLDSTLPVVADVINAAGVRSFGAYGIQACYDFHGYTLREVSNVSLGGGITGQTMSFSTPSNGDWSIVYWIWPVKTGTQTRYERIVLYLLNTADGTVRPPASVPGVSGQTGALNPSSSLKDRLSVNRAFLVSFARDIVQEQTKLNEPAIEISQVRPPQPSARELYGGEGSSPARATNSHPSGATKAPSRSLSPGVIKLHEAARREASRHGESR